MFYLLIITPCTGHINALAAKQRLANEILCASFSQNLVFFQALMNLPPSFHVLGSSSSYVKALTSVTE